MKPVVISGSGSSIRHISPEMLKGVDVIAVNSSILHYPNAKLYITTDPGMAFFHSWRFLRELSCEVIMICTHHNKYDSTTGNVLGSEFGERFKAYEYRKFGDVLFNKEGAFIGGVTGTQMAAHYAWRLGYSPIILIGCDCCNEDGKRYWHQWPGFEHERDYTLKKEYDLKIEEICKPHGNYNDLLDFNFHWQKIVKVNPELQLINCSTEHLAIRPFMSISEALERYNK